MVIDKINLKNPKYQVNQQNKQTAILKLLIYHIKKKKRDINLILKIIGKKTEYSILHC